MDVANIGGWTSASHLLEAGLGGDKLVFKPIPVFLTVHNAAEVITCGFQKFVQKEQTSHLKVCSVLFLLAAAVCLPLCDTQTDETEELGLFICGAVGLCIPSSRTPLLGPIAGFEVAAHQVWTVGILSDVAHSEAKKQHNLGAICSLEFPCKDHSEHQCRGLGYRHMENNQGVITASLSPFFFVMTANVLTISWW
ncbi:hypothetical protein EK904_007533 [Melospiza melodia maxima]|nr:hypothetical protein EK904_007533 [Melospiza melodia maxima]